MIEPFEKKYFDHPNKKKKAKICQEFEFIMNILVSREAPIYNVGISRTDVTSTGYFCESKLKYYFNLSTHRLIDATAIFQ